MKNVSSDVRKLGEKVVNLELEVSGKKYEGSNLSQSEVFINGSSKVVIPSNVMMQMERFFKIYSLNGPSDKNFFWIHIKMQI